MYAMFEIMPANASHSAACNAISRAVEIRPGVDARQGFMVESITETAFADYLSHGLVRVAVAGTKVGGFLIAYARGSEPFDRLQPYLDQVDQVEWTDSSFLLLVEVYYVHHKATAGHYRRRGVARALYAGVLSEFPRACFFGATMEKTVLNEASKAVRGKLGFRRGRDARRQTELGISAVSRSPGDPFSDLVSKGSAGGVVGHDGSVECLHSPLGERSDLTFSLIDENSRRASNSATL